MSIIKKSFGFMPDGTEVFSYLIDNEKNVQAEILNYGGIIRRLLVKDNKGEYQDVVLGRETLIDYLDNSGYFGAIIGRCGNRIAKGNFLINGISYNIPINDGKNSLHGGIKGFDKYVWDVAENDNNSITLSIISPDNDEGFPGNLKVSVTYTLTQNDGLLIHYEAVSDKDTIVNLTNHSYFNLNGIGNGNIYDLDLLMNCSFYTPNSKECMPYGEILSVNNTPFDFRTLKKVGRDINSDYEQIAMFGGFDHNFVIDGVGFRKAAEVYSEKSGICMEMYTDKPGVQLYTGNVILEENPCKDSKIYQKHEALCLETQFFPNSTSFSHYPSPILRAKEKYDYKTEYRFTIK